MHVGSVLGYYISMTNINSSSARWHLYIDGASRNNPGPAGAGVYLLKDSVAVIKQGFFLGVKTNNQAEYLALLLGLHCAHKHVSTTDFLVISTDSQLLARQLTGEYAVKHPDLQPLFMQAKKMLASFNYGIRHVMRTDNTVADHLANIGIDKKIPVPQEFYVLLE